VNTIDNPKEHYIALVIEEAEQNTKEGVDEELNVLDSLME